MATSGSYEAKINNGVAIFGTRAWGKFEWERTAYSHTNNTSTIAWKVYLSEEWGISTPNYEKYVIVEINGGFSVLVGKASNASAGQYQNILSGTSVISHNDNGSKTFDYKITISSWSNTGKAWDDSAMDYYDAFSSSGTLDELSGTPSKILDAPENITDEEYFSIKVSAPGREDSRVDVNVVIQGNGKTYKMSKTGLRISGSSDTITFQPTETQRANFRSCITSGLSKTITYEAITYAEVGEETITLTNTAHGKFTILNGTPTLAPTVEDAGSASKLLTNDPTGSMIKYYNAMKVACNAAARKGATIKEYKITNGSNSITTASGSFNYTDSNTFIFWVKDSRGSTATKTITFDMVDYIVPTCNLVVKSFSVAGVLTYEVSGQCFNDIFGSAEGAQHNEISVDYRLKIGDGSYSAWKDADGAIEFPASGGYKITASVPDLDTALTYTIQARVVDLAKARGGIASAARVAITTPVFDWGKNDFRFNVNLKCSQDLAVARRSEFKGNSYYLNNRDIYGTATDGTELNAFSACNGSNNLVIGYGSYTNEVGTVNVMGNKAGITAKGDVNITSNVSGIVKINGFTMCKNNVLFSGGLQMGAANTATLSAKVSAQPHGIVLIFSYFDTANQEPFNHTFQSVFIPKQMVASHSGVGYSIPLFANVFGMAATKYVYIYDAKITGNANNTTEGTSSITNIPYNNNKFVLRYVIGV